MGSAGGNRVRAGGVIYQHVPGVPLQRRRRHGWRCRADLRRARLLRLGPDPHSEPGSPPRLPIHRPEDLDLAILRRISLGGYAPSLAGELVEAIESARARMLEALESGGRVYGVNTGM